MHDISHELKQFILWGFLYTLLEHTQDSNPELNQRLPSLDDEQVPYLIDHPFGQLFRKQGDKPITSIHS